MIYAVQSSEFNGKPWYKYTSRLVVARKWARQFGAPIMQLKNNQVTPLLPASPSV